MSGAVRVMEKTLRALMIAIGLAMLVPSAGAFAQEQGCTIKCERCVVDTKTGTAECTNCTITGCKVSLD